MHTCALSNFKISYYTMFNSSSHYLYPTVFFASGASNHYRKKVLILLLDAVQKEEIYSAQITMTKGLTPFAYSTKPHYNLK